MERITFRPLENWEFSDMLPRLFSILYGNMNEMAPTGNSCEEDLAYWITHIRSALEAEKTQITLMFASGNLAGYFQYSVEENVLIVEEVEISSQYQRTMVFYRFCRWLMEYLPENIVWVESYVRKENSNSLGIHQKLGMEIMGENRRGTSYHMRGDAARIKQWFAK